MKRFWMCYVEGRTTPTRVHGTLEDAQEEAKRLARLNEGRKVYVLVALHCCQAIQPPVEWTVLE